MSSKPIFECKICNFKSTNRKDYKRHLTTKKHKINISFEDDNTYENSDDYDDCDDRDYSCKCGKVYNSRQGLWKHKVSCSLYVDSSTELQLKEPSNSKMKDDNKVVELLIEQNKQLMEIVRTSNSSTGTINNTNNNSNNTTNNTNNNQFNLNIFLKEDCKDAMNLMDFVNSLDYRLEDVERIGRIGYAEAISKMMIEGLKGIDVKRRPIHCSDVKRESMYVKDDNEWTKDTGSTRLKKAIKYVGHNNLGTLQTWKDHNPGHEKSEGYKSETYLNMCTKTMDGLIDEDESKFKKIMKKLASETAIDKECANT
jgi:hypothetical protein